MDDVVLPAWKFLLAGFLMFLVLRGGTMTVYLGFGTSTVLWLESVRCVRFRLLT